MHLRLLKTSRGWRHQGTGFEEELLCSSCHPSTVSETEGIGCWLLISLCGKHPLFQNQIWTYHQDARTVACLMVKSIDWSSRFVGFIKRSDTRSRRKGIYRWTIYPRDPGVGMVQGVAVLQPQGLGPACVSNPRFHEERWLCDEDSSWMHSFLASIICLQRPHLSEDMNGVVFIKTCKRPLFGFIVLL